MNILIFNNIIFQNGKCMFVSTGLFLIDSDGYFWSCYRGKPEMYDGIQEMILKFEEFILGRQLS